MNRAEDKVVKIEATFHRDLPETNKIEMCKAKQEFNARLKVEEVFWRQKVNIKWIKEGI